MFQFDWQGNDYLSIYDGQDFQSQQIHKATFSPPQESDDYPISIYSSGSHMLVQFVTDHEWTGSGFTAKFSSTDFFLERYTLCNLLDLKKRTLIVDSVLPKGTYCQWSISSEDDDTYVTLEFQEFNVRNIVAIKE